MAGSNLKCREFNVLKLLILSIAVFCVGAGSAEPKWVAPAPRTTLDELPLGSLFVLKQPLSFAPGVGEIPFGELKDPSLWFQLNPQPLGYAPKSVFIPERAWFSLMSRSTGQPARVLGLASVVDPAISSLFVTVDSKFNGTPVNQTPLAAFFSFWISSNGQPVPLPTSPMSHKVVYTITAAGRRYLHSPEATSDDAFYLRILKTLESRGSLNVSQASQASGLDEGFTGFLLDAAVACGNATSARNP